MRQEQEPGTVHEVWVLMMAVSMMDGDMGNDDVDDDGDWTDEMGKRRKRRKRVRIQNIQPSRDPSRVFGIVPWQILTTDQSRECTVWRVETKAGRTENGATW